VLVGTEESKHRGRKGSTSGASIESKSVHDRGLQSLVKDLDAADLIQEVRSLEALAKLTWEGAIGFQLPHPNEASTCYLRVSPTNVCYPTASLIKECPLNVQNWVHIQKPARDSFLPDAYTALIHIENWDMGSRLTWSGHDKVCQGVRIGCGHHEEWSGRQKKQRQAGEQPEGHVGSSQKEAVDR
jgi:hypothetical protein